MDRKSRGQGSGPPPAPWFPAASEANHFPSRALISSLAAKVFHFGLHLLQRKGTLQSELANRTRATISYWIYPTDQAGGDPQIGPRVVWHGIHFFSTSPFLPQSSSCQTCTICALNSLREMNPSSKHFSWWPQPKGRLLPPVSCGD